MLISIILWVIFGAVVGFVADLIDSSVSLSWPERIVVGVVGAVVGGTIAHLLTTGSLDITSAASFDIISLIVSVVGALIAIFVWKKVKGSKTAA